MQSAAPAFNLEQEPPLPNLVAAWAVHRPDGAFCVEVGGRTVTYGEADADADTWASALAHHGVRSGDIVLSMLTPSWTGVALWLGAGRLGAVDGAVNTDFRGRMLEYIITDTAARIAVIDSALLPRIAELDSLGALQLVVVVADDVPLEVGGVPVASLSSFLTGAQDRAPAQVVRREDPACVIYTSGTTGPSKGAVVTWAQLAATLPAQWTTGSGTAEAYYMPFPMYHVVARTAVCLMARHGGALVLRRAFSVKAFWDDIRDYKCTFTLMAGGVPAFLLSQPPHADDAKNPLRKVVMAPVISNHQQFAARFDVEIVTGYNMTEISLPLYFPDGIPDWRSCGRLREGYPHYQVRLIDSNGNDVADGEAGEMIVRTATPGTLNAGYLGKPEATAQAWRNGWFHTGDAFRRNESGHYFFVDRLKDTIRRRGENISSFEVESIVMEHPDVAECAAVGVPAQVGEDEVQIWVVPRAGRSVSPAALLAFLAPRMPRFMIPRYVQVAESLPKTEATQRVQKHVLRARADQGLGWDGAIT